MAQLLGSSTQSCLPPAYCPPAILIADDQPDLVDALRLLLKPEGMHVDAVHSPESALAAVQRTRFDLVLMDLNYTGDTTSGREGIDLLSRLQALDGTLPVVVMTGWGSIDLAVEAMRRGVRDFVQKPWDNAALVALLHTEIAAGRERRAHVQREARELDEARRIQRTLLPAALPQMEGFELAGIVAAGLRRRRRLLRRHPLLAAAASRCRSPTWSARAFPRRC